MKPIFVVTAVLALVIVAAPASAAPIYDVDLELALLIDSSGSIGADGFALQRDAYVSALTALLPTSGSVAVGVWQFSNTVNLEFATRIIDSALDKQDLLDAIAGMTWLSSTTQIAGAIDTASADLNDGNGISSMRQIIDVSTDGNQVGTGDPAVSAANAIANGIEQVNGIFVGSGIDSSWVPAGSFKVFASSFAEFRTALNVKLAREIVPEPGTLVLLGGGLGLIGLVSIRRRRNRKAA